MVLLVVLLAVTGCDAIFDAFEQSAEATPIDEALMARGVEVYRANYCGSCHALSAANTRGNFGPIHDQAGLHAAEYIALPGYSGEATDPASYIRESILNPHVFYTPGYETTNHHMPAFTHLPEEDIEAMVYMLVNQR